MQKTRISTEKAFVSQSPLTQAIRQGNMLFVSGQVPVDSKTMIVVSDEFEVQVRHVLSSVKAIMEAAGLGLSDIGKMTVFLTDMSRFMEMNKIYQEFFPQDPPARTCIGVKELPRGSQIEMEAMAVVE